MIHYVKGSIFKAPRTQLLTHACNCQGVWGSGIALEFKNKFSEEYNLYQAYCDYYAKNRHRSNLLGGALVINEIGCLFTSENYGKLVDPPEKILYNTEYALKNLLSTTTMDIAMPKINSGLFKVPWEQTAEIIEKVSGQRNIFVYTNE